MAAFQTDRVCTPPTVTICDIRTILGKGTTAREIEFLRGFYGGSRVICDPAPVDTDNDIVLLVDDAEVAMDILRHAGWVRPNEVDFEVDTVDDYEGDGDTFYTLRKGEYNIMLFSNRIEYGAVLAATCIAMKMNLTEKADRYALFETARGYFR